MKVVVRQSIQLPFRTKLEVWDREFTVRARTRRQAIAAIRSAGIKGEIIEVREG